MNKNITSPNGLKLLTAGKYCDQDITVKPVLQEKTTTENGDIVADSGYAGLSKVTVNVASGASLNIAYGDTAPEDTSKLWVEGAEPSKVIATNQMNGSETLSLVNAYLPQAINNACCASVGSNIYVFGGSSSTQLKTILKFNTTTKTLTTLSATLPQTINNACCASVGTNIYVFGGNSSNYLNTILKFDTITETLTTLSARLPSARYGTWCTSVGTNIYIFGGVSGSTYYNTVLKFNTTTETLTTLNATLFYSMIGACCASVGTNIYIFGGNNGTTYYNSIRKFDTTTETFKSVSANLPNVMSYTSCASVGTNIYIFGGSNSSGRLKTILKFDTITETITALSVTLPQAINNACCASVGSNIYIFGGSSGGVLNTIYDFVVAMSLPANQLLLNTTLNKNLFKIINAESAEIEIGVNAVYRGNANNIAELETANVYDANQYAWVDIQSGAVVEKLASVVTITSQASEYAFNVYDGTNTSGNLVATLGGANGALTAKVPCFSGYLYFQNTNASTAWEGFTVASNMTVTGGTDNYQLVQVNGDGAISATVVEKVVTPQTYNVTVINNSTYGYTLYDPVAETELPTEGTVICTAGSDGIGYIYVSIEEGVSLYIDNNTVNSGNITYDNEVFTVESDGSITINYEAD